MKIKIINTLFIALLATVISTSVLAGKNDKSGNKPISYLKIIATIGPLAYLSDATIIVKNAKNKVIAKGKTNFRGATSIKLSAESLTHQPLKIISSGGQIVYVSTYDITKMKSFRGNLGAEQTNMTVGSTVFISLDFMSTIANGLVTKKTSYADALSKVRDAFDIPNKVSNRVLSYTNQYVALEALEKAAKRHKGYNNYINYIINKIKFGNSITELNPISVPASVVKSAGLKPKSAVAPTPAVSEVGAFPTCPAIGTTLPGPTPTSNSTSTSVLTDFVSLAFDGLLFKTGFGTTYNPGVNGLIGTALTLGATSAPAINSGPSSAYTAISTQLNCISSQVEYLSGMVEQNTIATLELDANTCATQIDAAIIPYQTIIAMAIPSVNAAGVTTLPSQENSLNPLNFDPNWTPQSDVAGPTSNTAVNNSYAIWAQLNGKGATTASTAKATCFDYINKALFQPAAGDSAAWTDFNQATQLDNVWYTQSSVQALQNYIIYWQTYVYYQFVLFNEYLNLTQASYITSSPYLGTIEGGSACDPSITTPGGTFCTWANNFKNAYPPTLYSDEIAIPSNGLAVIPYPTSQALNLPATSSYSGVSGINANYFGENWVSGIGVTCSNYAVCNNYWQYGDVYLNGTSESESPPTASAGIRQIAATAPSSAVYNPSLTSIFGSATTEANKTLLNAQGGYSPSLSTTENSYIETYTTPQVPHTQVITSTQLPNLGSLSNGQSALTFFYNAINQDNPTSPLWSGLSATEIAYFTSDNIVTVTDQAVTSSFSFPEESNGDGLICSTGTNGNSVGSINGQNCNQLQVQMAAYLNGSTPILQNCGDDECTNAGNPSATQIYPIMAQLLGRTWWSGAGAAASDFIAPTPLTPAPAPTIIGASINGASVDVGFLPLSSTTTPTITSFVATCQNSNGSVSVSGTSSPIEVTAPAPVDGVTTPAGGAITCFVQALNGGGSGYPSASVTAAVGALPIACVGEAINFCPEIHQACNLPVQSYYIATSGTFQPPSQVLTGAQCVATQVRTDDPINPCLYPASPTASCIYQNLNN